MTLMINPAVLSAADRGSVLGALAQVANKPPQNWLSIKHPARKGQLDMKWEQASLLPASKLIDAVAVAIPTHCVDGWSFAARSLNALINGDAHAARHMAYYAQLRAGLCLLANLGIGLFDGLNFAVTTTGAGATITRLDPPAHGNPNRGRGLGTHTIVWNALDAWGHDADQSQVFLDLVKFQGNSLRDILDILWPGFIHMATVRSLIEAWGLDLRRGLEEKKTRNISSYAAQSLNPLKVSASDTTRFIEHTWRLFQPSGGAGFDLLDRHLIRKILQKQHDLSDPHNDIADGAIGTRYNQLPSEIRLLCNQGFIVGTTESRTLEILRLAASRAEPASPLHMLARALLLLRAATAFTHTSLSEAGVNTAAGALRPWLDQVAIQRGFWKTGAPLVDVGDLWYDVELALDELATSRKPRLTDLATWRERSKQGLPFIGEAERIAMWSLCA